MKKLLLFSLFLTSSHLLIAGTLPNGFAEQRVGVGLDGTCVAYAPDGRVFVTQKKGVVNIIKNGVMLPTPFIDVQSRVDNRNERGLQSMVFDPDFATNGYIYLYYCLINADRNIVTRVTANGDVAVAGSEVVIVQLEMLPGSIHNGGGLFFKGGKLFIATGEGSNASFAQSFSSLLGKVLRINKDGSIPTDNPFYQSLTGQFRLIYALGFRNPFRASVQPGTERVFINDVGGTQAEEINELIAGKNYGWPIVEGKITTQVPPANYQDPLYAYNHSQGCAIAGGTFYNPGNTNFPSKYVGKYFFGDYCSNYIRVLDPATGLVTETFATNVNRPISFTVGNDGSFYYLARGGLEGGSTDANTQSCCGEVWKVNFTNSGVPTISAHPHNQTVSIGGSAVFAVGASGNAPLSYQWQRNGVNIPGATDYIYEFQNATLNDNGSIFRAVVTNNLGTATSNGATLTVTSNLPPLPVIVSPTEGTEYIAGTTLNFSGSATDPEDGVLPASAFTWEINFHHATHTHPALPPTSGITSGSYALSANHDPASDVWYRIYLTVTDAAGQSTTVYRDVHPVISDVTLQTNQSNLKLVLDGTDVSTPYTFTGVAGILRTVSAPLTQTIGNTTYKFLGWSDGGAAEHVISTPDVDQNLIAYYTPILLEGEFAELSGVTLRWGYPGFTGTGFADFDIASGAYVEWVVNLPAAGDFAIDFRYANGALKDRPLELKVNNETRVASLSFAPTGTWTNWTIVKTVQALKAGINTIRLTSIGQNGGNFDHIQIYQNATPNPVAAAPAFSPSGGTYTSAQLVTISSTTAGAAIYYTLDGTTPTTASTLYAAPVNITASATLKALAVKSGMVNSSITSASYTINTGGGTGFSTKAEAEDATLLGVLVKNNLLGYSGSGFVDYEGLTGTYIEWTVTVPGAGPYKIDFRYSNGGSKDRPLEIRINNIVTEGSKAFPVTGGWANWSTVSSTVNLNAGTNKIKATTVGMSGGNVDYIVVTEEGVTSPTVAAPLFNPAAGTYSAPLNVTLSSPTPNAIIYYTLNGSTPTIASTLYSGPIVLSASRTIKAIAAKDGYLSSAVSTATYTIVPPPFETTLEAENAVLSGVQARFGYPGWTGTGFGDYINLSNDYIQWTVNAPSAGQYSLQFRYALPTGNRPLQLKVNGVTISASFNFPATGSWSTWAYVTTTVTLNAGTNTIRTTAIGFSGGNIDHLKVTNSTTSVTALATVDYVQPAFIADESESTNWLEVYPIPVQDHLTIRAQEPVEYVGMVNAAGLPILPSVHRESEYELKINVSGLAPGVTVLMLKVGTRLVSRKVIID
jgi:glucose/arabinose dehydrogenase